METSSASPANPYAPPRAEVSEIDAAEASAGVPLFFAVSVTKLALMLLGTFGFYSLYWSYRNWMLVKERGEDVQPAWRALFAIFFCYGLFKRMRDAGAENADATGELPAGPLAAGWIIASFTGRLPDPYSLIGLLSFPMLMHIQSYVNRLNQAVAPDHDPNSRLSIWNWLIIVPGVPFFLFCIYAILFIPD